MPPSPSRPAEGGTPLLLDTTVLSNFVKVGHFSLLREIFPATIRIATQVCDELKAGGLDSAILEGVAAAWLRLVAPESERELSLYREYSQNLGAGESASLAIAICRSWAMATDDRAARQAARTAGVRLTGSVGILIAAVRANILTQAEGDTLLRNMRRQGFHFPISNLDGLM
jgi:predicted nucleic acid-binding protein